MRSNNCGELIRKLHPAAVDVMTGVELAPGRKSEELLDALLDAMESAENAP